MCIFITGGAGFIGTHIVRLLLDTPNEIVIYDRLNPLSSLNSPKIKYIKGDLSEDIVIHMASLIEVSESVKNPLLFAENNILGSIKLLEAMKNTGVKRIVFSSSATVYGNPDKLPLTEDSPVMAANPYGMTKVAVENLIRSYHLIHGFDSVILRYFNPYGPGENHQPETHAIPNIIKSALADKPIPLYWQGQGVRDFIYVEDLAQAHIDVLGLKGWNIFNVGTGNGAKIIDILNMVSEILGHDLKTEDLGNRAGDVPALYASSALLEKTTGWKAKTDLKEGLKKTIEWFKAQQDESRIS
jgi:UDP-glucose 4-epimerase